MRKQDELLLDFCAAQYHHFEQAAWLGRANQDNVKIAAMLLSAAAWYNKSQELNALCQLCGWPKERLPDDVKATRFDCARFMSMLKRRLSIR